jgi:hypothetical protein
MAPSRRSLLAEMASRFAGQREVLATSGLGYVLRVSSTARDALRTWLAERGVAIPPDLAYGTEVIDPEQEGRPDVVGAVGKERYLIIEGKFWASLTDNQPVGYLHSLEDGGCLLVVAPELRFETVGAELVRRCQRADLEVPGASAIMRGGVSPIAARWSLGVVSWRVLLGRLHASLVDHGEAGLAADVEQLVGLSELEDQDAFLPVTSTDLSTPTPRRVRQFMELVDGLSRRGEAVGLFSLAGFRSAGALGWYARYVAAGPVQLAISADLRRWAEQRMTPLWVEAAVDPGTALADLAAATPPGVFFDGTRGRPVIPLEIPLHVERDELIEDLLRQVRAFLARINGCTPTVPIRLEPDLDT